MLTFVIGFNVVAIAFAFIAYRAPKVRLFDVADHRRKQNATRADVACDLTPELDATARNMYRSWSKPAKSSGRHRVAA